MGVEVNRKEPGTLQIPSLWQLVFPSALSCSPLLRTWLFDYLLDLEISRLPCSLTSLFHRLPYEFSFFMKGRTCKKRKVPKHKPSTLFLNHLHSWSHLSWWQPAFHYWWENCLSQDSETLAETRPLPESWDKVVASAVWAAGCEFHTPVRRTCSIRIFMNNFSTLLSRMMFAMTSSPLDPSRLSGAKHAQSESPLKKCPLAGR